MKKFILLILVILVCGIAKAQFTSRFKMNYDGGFTTQEGKSFDVAIFDNKDATELYDMVKKNISLTFRSPKDVESNVDDKIISIYGYAPRCTFFTAPGMKFYLSFDFSLKFQFKDGKIRIEAPILYEMRGSAWENLEKTFRAKGIFSRDGVLSDNPKKRQTVTMLEDYFNKIINDIINGNYRSNEDW